MIRAKLSRWMGTVLVAVLLAGLAMPATARAQKAAVMTAVRTTEVAWYQYVIKKVTDTNLYPDGVDQINICCSTPTLAQLSAYKLLVVLASDYGIDSGVALGSVLGDYMAMVPGSAVLLFYPFTWQTGLGSAPAIGDKFLANYALTTQSSTAVTTATKRGTALTNDPVASGVSVFTCGSACTRLTGLTAVPGATVSAYWDDGSLLAVRGSRRVDLNMLAADDSVISGSWSADGGSLITNAIMYLGASLAPMPTSVSFPSTPLGGSSAPTTVTFKNLTTSAMAVTGIGLSGSDKLQFAFKAPAMPTVAMPMTVPPGSSFTVDVSYRPQVQGTHGASLDLDLANLSRVSVALTGSAKGNLYVVRSPVDFGGIPTGTTAGPLSVRITNIGTDPVDLDKPTIDDTTHYELDLPVPDAKVTLIKGASYPMTVKFNPGMTPGQFPAQITVTSTDDSSPLQIPVRGLAGPPQLQVPYTSLVLPDVPAGGMGMPVNLILANIGNSELDVTAIISSAADFVVPMPPSDMNPIRIAAGASTTFQLVFAPKDHGLRTGTLTIKSNEPPPMGMPSSDKIVNLIGTGTVPQLRVDLSQVDFGTIALGSSISPQTVTLYNDGDGDLNVTDLSIPMGMHASSFSISGAPMLPFPIHAGGAVPFTVNLVPKEAGALSASLRVVTDITGMGGTAMVALKAVVNGAIGQVSPATLDFGAQKVKIPAAKTVTITNNGNQPLTILHAQLGQAMGPFSAALPPDNTQVMMGSSLTINVTVTCPMVGAVVDHLELDTDDPAMAGGTKFTIPLSATGTMSSVSLSDTALNFGPPLYVGQTSPMMAVTVTNTGPIPVDQLTVTNSGIDAADFPVAMGFKTKLMPGEMTDIAFTFQPHIAKAQNAAVAVISADGIPAMMMVALTGSSLSPMVTVQPGALQFEATPAGQQSMVREVTLSNPGTAVLNLELVPPGTGDFVVDTSQTMLTLNPGDVTRFGVTFAPQSAGAKTDNIDLRLKGTTLVVDSVSISGMALPARADGSQGCSTSRAPTMPFGLVLLVGAAVVLLFRRRNAGRRPLP